jgi:uncharacterized protein
MRDGRGSRWSRPTSPTDAGCATVIEAADAFGIDLLINNAGLGRFGPHLANPAEAEAMTVRVNAEATTRLCRGLFPGMLARARTDRRRAGARQHGEHRGLRPGAAIRRLCGEQGLCRELYRGFAGRARPRAARSPAGLPGSVATAFGERAGYRGGRLPGAITPEAVAQRSLAALGRQKVVYTDCLSEKGLGPVTGLRGLGAMGLATGLGVFQSLQAMRR